MSVTTITEKSNNPFVVISWNVDGYNDDTHNWLKQLIQNNKPDVIFLSETKRSEPELIKRFSELGEYNYIINSHQPYRYHGVIFLIRKDHEYQKIEICMNIDTRKDATCNEAATGRVIVIKLLQKNLFIVGSYVPNSGRSDKVKLDYRTRIWDPTFEKLLETLRASGPTMWVGDINAAATDLDVSNPKNMCKYAGFTPQERANLKKFLENGEWIDIWRQQHPNEKQYTWRGYPHREKYGMRLDNIIISKSLLPFIMNSFIMPGPESSDHVPIGVYLSFSR